MTFIVRTVGQISINSNECVGGQTFVHELVGSYFVGIVPVFVSLSTFGFLSLHIMTNSR